MSDRGMDRRQFLRSTAAAGALAALQTQIGGLRRAHALLAGDPPMLARVRAGSRIAELASAFDLTEHGHGGWFDVVLHPGDRRRLERAGFEYEVTIPDLIALDIAHRTGEREAQRAQPEQRLTYRTLAEYEADLAELAAAQPSLVRLIAFPHTTYEGRTVYGVEMSAGVNEPYDGRPTSIITGLHHAREWPSAELTIMLAQDLAAAYAAGDPEIVALLGAIRVFLVPVVNPDGFVRSRETVSDWVAPAPGGAALVSEYAYHRKNMRRHSTLPTELGRGVDPNRNYPFLWGGIGSSHNSGEEIYHGPGPGSEPEVANMLDLMRGVQALTLITNHTYSNLVLRPWGHTNTPAPDEAILKSLGDALAAENGYSSIRGIQLYPTTGTTDDWLYGVCGGLGYTFEIGSTGTFGLGNVTPVDNAGFHPQYNLNVPGLYQRNRGAFLELLRATADAALHCVLRGTAPAGTILRLRKEVDTRLSKPYAGEATFHEVIESTLTVGPSGTFSWHVNPSPLPETVAAIAAGSKPSSARERYELFASHPGGATRYSQVLAERGKSYTLDLT